MDGQGYDAAMWMARWRWVLVPMIVVVAGCVPQMPCGLPRSSRSTTRRAFRPSPCRRHPPVRRGKTSWPPSRWSAEGRSLVAPSCSSASSIAMASRSALPGQAAAQAGQRGRCGWSCTPSAPTLAGAPAPGPSSTPSRVSTVASPSGASVVSSRRRARGGRLSAGTLIEETPGEIGYISLERPQETMPPHVDASMLSAASVGPWRPWGRIRRSMWPRSNRG